MSDQPSITLTEHFIGFLKQQVASGRYRSEDDVVRAALRLLEEREAKLEALRNALIEGEESGPAEPFDLDEFLAERMASRSGKHHL